MRILFTGASSFTGFWISNYLAKAGHEIFATFRSKKKEYDGLRKSRIEELDSSIEQLWGLEFGDQKFLQLIKNNQFDLFCHHGSSTKNYRSPTFDIFSAVQENTFNSREALTILKENNCQGVLFTGTTFEPYEGIGDPQFRAFNPYGLSKHFSYEIFRYECEALKLPLGKFVIANPFGPYEEARFTDYLIRTWGQFKEPHITSPNYIRDNIPVSLLASNYVQYCENYDSFSTNNRMLPSLYVAPQWSFANLVASKFSKCVGRQLSIKSEVQKSFEEPLIKINSMLGTHISPSWNEDLAWDETCDYWLKIYKSQA